MLSVGTLVKLRSRALRSWPSGQGLPPTTLTSGTSVSKRGAVKIALPGDTTC
jgi:hypothetical protein